MVGKLGEEVMAAQLQRAFREDATASREGKSLFLADPSGSFVAARVPFVINGCGGKSFIQDAATQEQRCFTYS